MGNDRFSKLKERLLSKKRILLLGGLALVGLCIVAWLIVDFYWSERESEAKMEGLRQQMADLAEPVAEPSTENVGETGEEDLKEEWVPNPYGALFAQNDDMAAWLVVDGTVINYPVMQTMEDENYYLERDFEGNTDKSGCLILDTDSSLYEPETTNLIIHGHNMKAGTMFGGLSSYESEDYCQDHKQITLYTKGEERQYEVIAAFYSQVYYVTDQVFKYYNFFQADTEEEFHYFYDNIKELSLYDTGVTAELGDKFLTLSTCAYHVEDGRFVVVAKEIGRGPKYE